MKKNTAFRALALASVLLAAVPAFAGTTATFLKQVHSYSADVAENGWYCNLSKAKAYATKNKMPLVVVWSNGDACGHCVSFENACKRAVFKNYVKESGVVWVFGYTKDGHDGARNTGSIYKFAYKNQTQFPLIRIYWPAGKVDVYTKGDDTTGGSGDTSGAKKAVSYFKSKLSKYKYTPPSDDEEEDDDAEPAVEPYTIEFAPNGATNEMDSVETQVGVKTALPACTLLRPDWSFTGWAKSATGSVAYKDSATVKDLTTVSNGTVTLYAQWKRITYRTYYTKLKTNITVSDMKGWTTSSSFPGMKWNSSTGKWSGKPTKAGTFTIKYKKSSSSATRKFVVVKDALVFADETAVSTSAEAGEELSLDLSPTSFPGAVKSVKVTGLPAGLEYSDGKITGASTMVGTFKVTVTAVSAKSQTLTRTITISIAVPDCCIGTFNGFVGLGFPEDASSPLYITNRGSVRISAPASAALSAKVVTAKASYSLSATGWNVGEDGTYSATLLSSNGKHSLFLSVAAPEAEEETEETEEEEQAGEQEEVAEEEETDDSFATIGVFTPSYGTEYAVWAQRAAFGLDSSGEYLDETAAAAMPQLVGKWYFKAVKSGSSWVLKTATAKTATVTLTVSSSGTAKLAGKIGSYAVSASSSVFLFADDVEAGFASADFALPVTVSKTKKTLNVSLDLLFGDAADNGGGRFATPGVAKVENFR